MVVSTPSSSSFVYILSIQTAADDHPAGKNGGDHPLHCRSGTAMVPTPDFRNHSVSPLLPSFIQTELCLVAVFPAQFHRPFYYSRASSCGVLLAFFSCSESYGCQQAVC